MDIVSRYEEVFCNAAIAKGDGLLSNDHELFETMKSAYLRLHNHPSGKKRIENLLHHQNDWVKSWVATQLLCENGNVLAKETLLKLTAESGMIGFGAKIVLSEYGKGSLASPFGIKP